MPAVPHEGPVGLRHLPIGAGHRLSCDEPNALLELSRCREVAGAEVSLLRRCTSLEGVEHCDSCHDDEELGFHPLMELTAPNDDYAEVCCIISNAIDGIDGLAVAVRRALREALR